MKLYKLIETCNGREGLINVYYTRELAEKRMNRPTRSSHAELVDGKYRMVDDVYTYTIEEFEVPTEDVIFDVYVESGTRISNLSLRGAIELYESEIKYNYAYLQLPQKQFGFTSCGITEIKNNRDKKYYEMKEAARKKAEEEERQIFYSPSCPWNAPGMTEADFI